MLEAAELEPLDHDLIEQAKWTADLLYLDKTHKVAAAVRTRLGDVFSGINIRTTMRFADVCGEVAAISAMVGAGQRDPEVIVAVRGDGNGWYELLPPCGRCRELISDFEQNTWVIVGTVEHPQKVRVRELLPLKAW
jgi:cytidine deaminase